LNLPQASSFTKKRKKLKAIASLSAATTTQSLKIDFPIDELLSRNSPHRGYILGQWSTQALRGVTIHKESCR
jgi:hypothetical protein